MRRLYSGAPGAQVHARLWDGAGTPLVCLHPAPHSGAWFETLAAELAGRRPIIAPDYPGYGGSDEPADGASIKAYARATGGLLDDLGLGFGDVDLLGFHTGCLVAVEMARLVPDHTRRLVLIDVPFFTEDQRSGMLADFAHNPHPPEFEALAGAWKKLVETRPSVSDKARGVGLFAEQMRGYPDPGAAFRAAFSYDCETRFPDCTAPALVLATKSMLSEPTRKAATVLPDATLLDRQDITSPALESGAAEIAAAVTAFLDTDCSSK